MRTLPIPMPGASSRRDFALNSFVLVLAVFSCFSLGTWGSGVVAAVESGVELPDDPLSGRLLFVNKGCVQCHGIAGSGPSIGPSLGEGSFGGSFLELGASLWNHAPGMSVTFEVAGFEWPEISEEETTELLAFLYFIDYLGRPGVASAGERVCEDQGCVVCHLVGGGAADVGPDLGELQRFASPFYVAQEIWNHGPSMLSSMRELGMPAPSFGVGDLADLSAFVRREAQAGSQERLLFAPGNPNRGRALFSEKGCTTCHGEGARGGSGGPDLGELELHRSAESIAGTMWNHALEMRDSMRRRGVGWPSFAQNELADLISFLYFLPFADLPGNPDRGSEVFRDRSCVACHSGGGLSGDGSGQSGPELAGGGVASSPAALVSAMWNHAPMMKTMILGEGLPWPELSGADLRDMKAFLEREAKAQ